ncbi:ligase-associated DNA damage response DEXH box helicase [Marivirga atlantica]|jgi:ATP-dependent Lhr-like helicase|uniref:Ligase-associated DNA damage response DEXH box helicase n=1 Tax=Marivirga atlantica TaxID=1548457 RepID=A0A937AAU7_9BACT|nr:ligase-associated DNA damage response DEXH box helicase [Marivirga atlantica]MBL0765465.1 ligase-associated DNA damage response DEXH box helicase [Marivirga atlantica]
MAKVIDPALQWFNQKNWKAFDFQQETWQHYLNNKSGLLNAPTGSGKTYALFLAFLMEQERKKKINKGLKLLWILPLRALAKDIQQAMQAATHDFNLDLEIALRTGDTSTKDRQKQKNSPPDVLITTPESLHLLLSQKNAHKYFSKLEAFVVDEWHELLGSKRAIQVELGLTVLKEYAQNRLKVWGISATIGNLEEAQDVLLGVENEGVFVTANMDKSIQIESILPDEVEKYPWAGHLGIKLIDKVLPIINSNKTTLIFTNTRSQTEIWYQQILEKAPELAGAMAMHHGSLNNQIRIWVEEALHSGAIKVVVCTSSLDLGVDFRPVDTIIQVGGPKGVSRFAQRAGRSGHRPGALSKIYFLPTHSLELIEGAALREAVIQKDFEARIPITLAFDVLIQFLVTLAVSDGLQPEEIKPLVKSTFCFKNMTDDEWDWCINFIQFGGKSLGAYDEYQKVVEENGVLKVTSRKIAMRHRLSIGTIVGDQILNVRYIKGGYLGTIEEYFISKLKPGDAFWFSGRNLEFVRLKDMTVQVRKSKKKNSLVPQWMGGRMPLSSQLAYHIRKKLEDFSEGKIEDIEIETITPLLKRQQQLSILPKRNQLLVESFISKEGFHIYFYPFEGRFIHEVLAGLIAYRISISQPITFNIAVNDYGFELLTDEAFDVEEMLSLDLLNAHNLEEDMIKAINETEMSKRKFRDIAAIAGLTFKGFPGKPIKEKHLQSSASIMYGVFEEYEPDNLLLKQAHREVIQQQLEQERLLKALDNINRQEIVYKKISKPTPLSFPIMVDRLNRQTFSTETLEERVAKIQAQLEKS